MCRGCSLAGVVISDLVFGAACETWMHRNGRT